MSTHLNYLIPPKEGKRETDERMASEMNNFIKVLISILTSLSYCYAIGKLVSKGIKRLVFFVPIVCLFLFVPLKLSSINLIGCTAFFISWLGSSKLLLFAFGKGPLASDPSISLGRFVLTSCLPIEIRKNPSINNSPNKSKAQGQKWNLLSFPIKALLLAILILVTDYLTKLQNLINQNVMLALYCLYVYLSLEVMLAVATAAARATLGLELEPCFDEPYLATSLQDFWGRRWNLMVTRTLRPTVYNPTLRFWAGLVGRRWAQILAVVATFAVSGLVHELIYYYLSLTRPTWEVTCFFVLQGLCLTVEIALKKALADTWRLPRVVSGPLTIGFVMLTSFWLFFPQMLRCKADVRLLQEYASLAELLMRNVVGGQRLLFVTF